MMKFFATFAPHELHLENLFVYLANRFCPFLELKFIKSDDSIDQWSNKIIEDITKEADDRFIFSCGDAPPIAEVNEVVFNNICNFEFQKFHLSPQLAKMNHQFIDKIDSYNILEADQDQQSRLCSQISIWDKEYFLDNIKQNMNPWQFEQQDCSNDGARILGLDSCLIHLGHLYRKLKFQNSWHHCVYSNKAWHQNKAKCRVSLDAETLREANALLKSK